MLGMKTKEGEMRFLISAGELDWFKERMPEIKWKAGDTEIKWNANRPEEVELARKAFNLYREKHPKALAFAVDKKTRKESTELKEFDPNAEMIVMQDWMKKG